jgi:hypothetical protein
MSFAAPYIAIGSPYPEVTDANLQSSLSTSYLDRLSILYLPTCVGSGYGHYIT